jgi:hypothetical protein
MNNPYGICEDHRTAIEEKILGELNREEVAKVIKRNLQDHCDRAVEQVTEYLQGEYAIVIEDIAKDRAKRMVHELLKGNKEIGAFFALVAKEHQWGPDKGKPFVYDPDGLRHAIFDAFKDEIAHAEHIALAEEVKRLNDWIRIERDARGRY